VFIHERSQQELVVSRKNSVLEERKRKDKRGLKGARNITSKFHNHYVVLRAWQCKYSRPEGTC